MNIYVGNLNYKVDENDLMKIFEEYGKVIETRVITDKFNGRSKGFGFVEMDDNIEAENAIKSLSGTTFMDREIIVNEARERKQF